MILIHLNKEHLHILVFFIFNMCKEIVLKKDQVHQKFHDILQYLSEPLVAH